MNFRRHRRYEEPEINFIPLIDVLLVILIFLMVTTTYSRFSELDIKLPGVQATPDLDVNDQPIMVAVSKAGELMVGDQKVVKQNLTAVLEKTVAGRKKAEVVVVINADADAKHQDVVNVMEAARQAGLTQLTFATDSHG